MTFDTLSSDQIQALLDEQKAAYQTLKDSGLKLDLTRGKPSPAQLDLSNELLSMPGTDFKDAAGTDTRNYGGLTGLTELREIFAEIMQVPVDQVVAGDNASLAMMHDTLVFALLHGVADSEQPWGDEEVVKFICPVPGYDRHFALLEEYGIEMLPVDLLDDGPDMAAVRELVKDPAVKGMWLVPTYSNPTGAVVSEAVAAELAALETAAPDFRIFWDNAYAVHHLTERAHQDRRHPRALLGVGTPQPSGDLRLDVQDHVRRCRRRASSAARPPTSRGTSSTSPSARSVPTRSTSCATRGSSRDVDGVHALMDKHRAILAPKFAGGRRRSSSARLGGYGVATLDRAQGRILRQPRRRRRLRVAGRAARRRGRRRADAGRCRVPATATTRATATSASRRRSPRRQELERRSTVLATCVLIAAAEQALAQ